MRIVVDALRATGRASRSRRDNLLVGYFDALSYPDFEEMVADLMTAVHGLAFRAGTRGRDGGIDVLAYGDDGRHVVQCKHFRDSTYSQLLSKVRAEATKLAEREPEFASYRFATSQRLAHTQRAEVATLLRPWIAGPDDVLGENHLQALLREHPEVEQRHVKLWIASAGGLRRALSARSYQRSKALLADIEERLPRFVQTSAFHEARAVLERESVCVIAGAPGIGKTTLAQMLVLDSMESGFQPYEIVPGSLADSWDLLDLDEPQVYLFDDFLGQTFLETTRTRDVDLMRFIRTVARRPRTRLVLTTRDYILHEAHTMSEVLARESDPAHRFTLRLPDLSRMDRARIFYNHVWFSPHLGGVAREAILRDRSYNAVIDHPSFNPRVIEWICRFGARDLTESQRERVAEFCVQALEHPAELWNRAFAHGIQDADRALLLTLLGLPIRAPASTLELAFETQCRARGIATLGGAFQRSLRVLDGSFITIARDDDAAWVSVANPSLIDFLQRQISLSGTDAETAFRGAHFFEQAMWLYDAHRLAPRREPDLSEAASAAFERTFHTPPAVRQSEWAFIQPRYLLREELDDVAARLRALCARAESDARIAQGISVWLPAVATGWLASLDLASIYRAFRLGPIDSLLRLRVLGPEEVARRVIALLEEGEPLFVRLERFELLVDAYEIAPAVVSEELDRQRQVFVQFAELSFREIGLHLDDLEDLATLQHIADTMGVVLSDEVLDAARELLSVDDDDDDEPEDDNGPGAPTRHRSDEGDDDVDLLFSRLGN